MRWIRALPLLVLIGLAIWISETGDFAPLRTVSDARAVASDGDSLRLANGDRIRLHAIDAPELAQSCTDAAGKAWPCGEQAKARLTEMIAGDAFSCKIVDHDRYGREVADCSTASIPDINAALVREGWAVALRLDGRRRYASQEADARAAKRGIWQGAFERPADWRAEHPRG